MIGCAWVIGSAVAGHACFTCITGEAAPSADYESTRCSALLRRRSSRPDRAARKFNGPKLHAYRHRASDHEDQKSAHQRLRRTNEPHTLDECFRVQGRQTWYIEPEEIQRDLDRFIRYYNLERTHHGYRLKGRTPAQALKEALGITEIPDIIPSEEIATPLPTAA